MVSCSLDHSITPLQILLSVLSLLFKTSKVLSSVSLTAITPLTPTCSRIKYKSLVISKPVNHGHDPQHVNSDPYLQDC